MGGKVLAESRMICCGREVVIKVRVIWKKSVAVS